MSAVANAWSFAKSGVGLSLLLPLTSSVVSCWDSAGCIMTSDEPWIANSSAKQPILLFEMV